MTERLLPAGTVTFLFTDIEGSTRLMHELGDANAPAYDALRSAAQLRARAVAAGDLDADELAEEGAAGASLSPADALALAP
jgi:hypothetical protein